MVNGSTHMEHNEPTESTKFPNNIQPREDKQQKNPLNGMSVCLSLRHTLDPQSQSGCLPQTHTVSQNESIQSNWCLIQACCRQLWFFSSPVNQPVDGTPKLQTHGCDSSSFRSTRFHAFHLFLPVVETSF